jgi:putative flippase GtrA
VKTLLAFFTLAGNLTLANDFPDIASVNFIRFAFLILSTIMTVYFFLECFQVTHKVGKHLRPRLVQLVRSKQALVIRFSKFGLVGGVGFGVDTFFYLFIQFLGADHSTARFISYWCAATNNWFLNRIFTFKDKDKDHHGTQWLKYMMMCGVSFILNGGTYFLLTSYIDFFSEYKFLAFMIGIGFGMTTNFTISHLIIFKNRGK